MVTTTEVTLHKCNRTRYNRSLIAPQLALLVGLMLVNCSDSLRSNLNIEFGTVHPAFHEVLDETNSLLSKFPPLTHSHDAIRFTMLQSQNHSMDASTEFSPTLVNASKNATFEESSNASMFWFVSMESTQEPVITLFPSLKENLRVCFFLSASKVSPQEEISRAPIREDQKSSCFVRCFRRSFNSFFAGPWFSVQFWLSTMAFSTRMRFPCVS